MLSLIKRIFESGVLSTSHLYEASRLASAAQAGTSTVELMPAVGCSCRAEVAGQCQRQGAPWAQARHNSSERKEERDCARCVSEWVATYVRGATLHCQAYD